MDWRLMEDPSNVENRNAGNGGDLVKHTVYLATLSFLLTQEPWIRGMQVRECHAGRGVYRIPNGDPRSRLLCCLYPNPTGSPVLLQAAQRKILGALHCWTSEAGALQWYAGSALINAFMLAEDHLHRLELYEWLPETRRILRSVLTAANPETNQFCGVMPKEEELREFDGEAYIEQQISAWGGQNLILLDPFAMWRQPSDQRKRDRYGAIIDALARRGADAPSLILFWTWGRAFPIAEGDLNGTIEPVRNGYTELRARLLAAGLHFVLVKWRWGLQFAMWVVVPGVHLVALRNDIDLHCRLLSDHLVQHGCRYRMSHPVIEVALD